MPASSGRVRMPHNNRMHSSAALKMTGIWKNTIGYDPYAAEGEETTGQVSATAHEQAQGLMALAKLSNQNNEVRGACKKCGMLGHLTFQCRNFLDTIDSKPAARASDSSSEEDASSSDSEEERRRRKKKKENKRRHRERSSRRSRSASPRGRTASRSKSPERERHRERHDRHKRRNDTSSEEDLRKSKSKKHKKEKRRKHKTSRRRHSESD